MKISKFEELTQFVSDEYLKMIETYSVQRPSENFMKFIEDTLVKYTKLYDKPLYKLQKQEVKNMYFVEKQNLMLDRAFATMPHGFIWKIFHQDLWEKMKYRSEELQQEEKEKAARKKQQETAGSTVPAIVVQQVSSPVPVEDVDVS